MINEKIFMLRKIIKEAFIKAKEAEERGDIPIGAVIFNLETKEIISSSGNEVEKQKNPLAHAEMIALEEAFKKLNTKVLNQYGIYSTLEPCNMCMGAISHALIGKVFFGAYKDNFNKKEYTPKEIMGGFSETKSSIMLKEFFKNIR